MALSESIEYDKIEVVTPFKHLQIRKATVIKRDGVELTRTFHRYSIQCGYLDDSDNLVDTDISGQPEEVKTICNAVWTNDVKAAWKAELISVKPPTPPSE